MKSTPDLPLSQEGIIVTQLLIVRDVASSRQFYERVLDAKVLMEGPPVILKFHNTRLILSTEGDPTNDRPRVAAVAPRDFKALTSALNLRVPNIHQIYKLWRSRGAEFLTAPKEHKSEIRCYLRDPDGHLIEVGQSK
jgi:lactoylglutathione lyase